MYFPIQLKTLALKNKIVSLKTEALLQRRNKNQS